MTTFDVPLTLSLFGTTLLTRTDDSGTPLGALASGKPLALLTFLHCAPAHTASREQLLDLLWSDADPESARHTLRQTLWYIKRKLGVDPLVSTGVGGVVRVERGEKLVAVGRDVECEANANREIFLMAMSPNFSTSSTSRVAASPVCSGN